MQKDSQSNEVDFVYLRSLLEFNDKYDESVWNLIATNVQPYYNLRNILSLSLSEQNRIIRNFINETETVYKKLERDYNAYLEDSELPIFYKTFKEYARNSIELAKKDKSKQRLNPIPDNTVSCQLV